MKPLRVSGGAAGRRAPTMSGFRHRRRTNPRWLFKRACDRAGQHPASDSLAATTQVALAYVRGLERAGIRAASRHFPERVGTAEAGHHSAAAPRTRVARLPTPRAKSFQEVSKQSDAATPPGHVILAELGAGYPVLSASRRIARQVIRRGRGCRGLLVTGDPKVRLASNRWLREAGDGALNARLDLLLIAFDHDTSFDALHGAPPAVRRAAQHGALDAPTLERRGAQRLQSFR